MVLMFFIIFSTVIGSNVAQPLEISLSSELVCGVKSFDKPIDLLPEDRSDALCITDAGTFYTYFYLLGSARQQLCLGHKECIKNTI